MNAIRPAGVSAQLKELRTRANRGVREVARLLEIPTSTYSTYELSYKQPYLPMKLARQLVSVLSGQGDPPITDAEVLALAGVDDPRHVPEGRPPHSQEAAPSGYVVIREYDVDVAAGSGKEPVLNWMGEAAIIAEWIVPRDFLPPEHRSSTVAVIRVDGDSMAPSLLPHDRVMVDLTHSWMTGDGIYLAWNGLGAVFKRLQGMPGNPPKVRIISDNPKHETYSLTIDEVKVYGRVIGKWEWW